MYREERLNQRPIMAEENELRTEEKLIFFRGGPLAIAAEEPLCHFHY
jgi:hypothetical protein